MQLFDDFKDYFDIQVARTSGDIERSKDYRLVGS